LVVWYNLNMKEKLQSNIWKYFLIILTSRRNFMPILSIYFLSLPNNTANQIGLYTAIGWIFGFIFEIPSGYLADRLGHKKTLIIAKFFLLLSTLSFIIGSTFIWFAIGATFLSLGFAFTSGTAGAFLHNTLLELKKENNFAIINGKIKANVSLISAVIILLLPLLTKISLLTPIIAFLFFDILGVIIVFTLYQPEIKYEAQDEEGRSILTQLDKFKGTGFYPMSILLGITGGLIMSLSPYNYPYVELLGFPIIFIGSIMAFSRVIWFIIGHNLSFFKKIPIKKLLQYEVLFFSVIIIVIAITKNAYIAGFLISIMTGYNNAKGSLYQEHYLNNFLVHKKYKATMLSIKMQIKNLFSAIFIVIFGYIVSYSFSAAYLIVGIFLFFVFAFVLIMKSKIVKSRQNN